MTGSFPRWCGGEVVDGVRVRWVDGEGSVRVRCVGGEGSVRVR